jgi:hypothetical protein
MSPTPKSRRLSLAAAAAAAAAHLALFAALLPSPNAHADAAAPPSDDVITDAPVEPAVEPVAIATLDKKLHPDTSAIDQPGLVQQLFGNQTTGVVVVEEDDNGTLTDEGPALDKVLPVQTFGGY